MTSISNLDIHNNYWIIEIFKNLAFFILDFKQLFYLHFFCFLLSQLQIMDVENVRKIKYDKTEKYENNQTTEYR